ncbi:MAG: aldo/keto reductase [Bacteroidota bacterium]
MDTLTAKTPTWSLANGLQIPQLGLGVLKARNGGEVEQAVLHALDSGYRLIDTAAIYGNESGVGSAIKQSRLDRSEIFITSKVWNSDQGYKQTLAAFERSLENLQTDYLDLYLIHWPVAGKFQDSWKALEELYRAGKVRAIGVSNFQVHHLETLLETAEIVPMVNQVELHPYLQQPQLQAFAQAKGIQLEAWRPIMMGAVLDIPELVAIGQAHGKSAVQVSLRWLIQEGVVVIPKSVTLKRIIENAKVFDFELSEQEMSIIRGLNRQERLGPDPDNFNF